MEEKKDLSLLLPFDLEAAKRGELLIWDERETARWVGVSSKDGGIHIIEINMQEGAVRLSYATVGDLRMAPLSWVDGRPVYKGDTLFFKDSGQKLLVTSISTDCPMDQLTWTKPVRMVQKEGWVNIYPPAQLMRENAAIISAAWATKEAADENAMDRRLACVRITWEEPACP